MELENGESVQIPSTPSIPSTPKTSKPSPTSSKLLTPPSSADSNGGRSTRKSYRRLSQEENQILLDAFAINNYLDAETRLELASKVNLITKQLNVRISYF